MNEHPLVTAHRLQKNRERINDLKAKFEKIKLLEQKPECAEEVLLLRGSLGVDEKTLAIQFKAAAKEELALERLNQSAKFQEYSLINDAKVSSERLLRTQSPGKLGSMATDLELLILDYESSTDRIGERFSMLFQVEKEIETTAKSDQPPDEADIIGYTTNLSRRTLLLRQIEHGADHAKSCGIKMAGLLVKMQAAGKRQVRRLRNDFLNLFDSPFSSAEQKALARGYIELLSGPQFNIAATGALNFENLVELAKEYLAFASEVERLFEEVFKQTEGPLADRVIKQVVLVGQCTCGCVRPWKTQREFGDLSQSDPIPVQP